MKILKKAFVTSGVLVLALSSCLSFAVTCQDGSGTCVANPPPGQVTSGLDLHGVDLSGKDYFAACGSTTVIAGQPTLVNKFVYANLDSIRAVNTSFYGCNMSGAHARGYIDAKGVNCTKSTVTGLILPYADMLGGNFTKSQSQGGLDLYYANAKNVNFYGANLPRTNADHVNFSGANMSYSNWDGSFLNGAYLATANVTYANLSNTTIHDVNMSCSNLTGVKLAGARITGSNLSNVVWSTLPDGSHTLAQVVSQPSEIGQNTWTTFSGSEWWVVKVVGHVGWDFTPKGVSAAW